MKRDMDLVRAILLKIEESPDGYAPDSIEIPDYSRNQIAYHLAIMIEAGLLHGDVAEGMEGDLDGLPTRITWQGHDFLDAAREPSRWGQAKRRLGRIGSASFEVWIKVLTELMLKGALPG
jgi:hypothetical protein